MPPQLTYQDQSQLPAFEGGLYDSSTAVDSISRTPGANVKQVDTIAVDTVIAAVAQVERFTVDTAADADAYTIKVGNFTFTGTSSGTNAETQRDAILAQMDADSAFKELYDTASVSTDSIDVTAKRAGTPFTVSATVQATSSYSWAQQTANTVGTQFKLTVDGHELRYQAASATEETESDAFLALIQADTEISALVDAAEGSGAAITLTAKTAGVPFTATLANENYIGQAGSGTISISTTTANQTGNPVPYGRGLAATTTAAQAVLPSATGFTFEGVSVYIAKGRPRDNTVSPPVTGDAEYRAAESMRVLRRGRIWVSPEDAVAPGDNVYLRHTAGAASDEVPGRFRTDADTAKADQISNARWITSASADGLAVLEINLP